MSYGKGFTLIELLVVIAVIGILSGMVLVTMSGARWKARDAKRMTDMKQLVIAQEFYNSDNGHYYTCSTTGGDCDGEARNYPTAIGTRMASTPSDPTNTGTLCDGTAYVYCGLDNTSDQQNFCYWAKLEESETLFLTATPRGNFEKDAVPADLTDCSQPG